MTKAMNLSDMNLIGVFGSPNNRRALIRLSNGRFTQVRIGDTLDGGQVTAIGDNALNYVKRGRLYMLAVPSG
jgi:Tfp pilus assembly protein PilP